MSMESFEGYLQELCCSLPSSDVSNTLGTLSTITQNALDHPGEEKYRRLRTTNKMFSQRVWCHQAARDFMTMAGWTQVDDTVVLLTDDFLQIALVELAKCKSMLEQQQHLSSTLPNGSASAPAPTTSSSATAHSDGKEEYQERMRKMRELQKKVDAEKKRIAEQIKADRLEADTKETRSSQARQLKFGANLNRFEDIGVDLNAGG